MRSIKAYFQRNVGRRGAVLLLFSAVFLFIGIKAVVDPAADNGRFVVYTLLDPTFRGILWIVPSIVGIITALRRKPKHDALGFAALVLPPATLFLSYAGSFVAFLAGVTMYRTGWVDAIEWLLSLLLLIVTSGWVEVEDSDKKETSE